jgi:hypothetical protein
MSRPKSPERQKVIQIGKVTLSTDQKEGATAKSRLGPNGTTNSSNSASTAEIIDNRTPAEKAAAKDGERIYPYAGRKPRSTSFSMEPAGDKKCEGSSCTMMGGKRRKSRKQRGSRKSKKSRRR